MCELTPCQLSQPSLALFTLSFFKIYIIFKSFIKKMIIKKLNLFAPSNKFFMNLPLIIRYLVYMINLNFPFTNNRELTLL